LTGDLSVRVTVDRLAAPVLAAADLGGYQQINFQVPWEAQSATSVGIAQGDESASFTVPLFPAWDVLFADASGDAVAQHASDYTAVTADHPARPEEWIVAYATNLGPVANQPPTGAPAPLDQLAPVSPGLDSLSVLLQGAIVETNYIGLVPGTVGVYQVNFRVSDNFTGGKVRLQIQKSVSRNDPADRAKLASGSILQWKRQTFGAKPEPDPPRRTELGKTFEGRADGAGDRLIRMKEDFTILFSPNEADRQAAAQLSACGFVADAPVQPGANDM
jgi:uncharacterized protein (TIGR03437 family)